MSLWDVTQSPGQPTQATPWDPRGLTSRSLLQALPALEDPSWPCPQRGMWSVVFISPFARPGKNSPGKMTGQQYVFSLVITEACY